MSSETFVEAEIWTIAQTDQGNVVLVRPKGSDLAVPIIIGQLETQSILIGMGGVEVPRPLTHDLAVSLLRTLQAYLLRIEINDLQEGTFYARLILRQNGEEFIVDARPSDAIGIAVRMGCPVFISEAIVDEAGISVNLVTEGAQVHKNGSEEAGQEEDGGLEVEEEDNDEDGDGGEGDGGQSPEAAGPGRLGAALGGRTSETGAGDEGASIEASRLREELEEAIAVEDYERAALLRDRLKELGAAP